MKSKKQIEFFRDCFARIGKEYDPIEARQHSAVVSVHVLDWVLNNKENKGVQILDDLFNQMAKDNPERFASEN
jgi:hypothetical protein